MERHIQSYLSEYYQIEPSQVKGYNTFMSDGTAIYPKDNEYKYGNFIYPTNLLSELKKIFYLDKDTLICCVESWVKSINLDADLTKYWELKDFSLPLVRRVFSQLFAQDIVSVQPLAAPMGQLLYLDSRYDDGDLEPKNYRIDE
jgi:hypothetical protein